VPGPPPPAAVTGPARLTRTGRALISVAEPEAEDEENSS
jgi:hypothetical protein